MLKDQALEVSSGRCKNALGQMFSIETVLVKKCLLKWFNRKFQQQFVNLSPIQQMHYESEIQINWKKDKCVICKLPLKVEPTNFKTPDDEMSYGGFIIRYEHKFLRNIYTEKQIQNSD